ncbi:hypothetical protein Poly30_54080 [Planctomycetes bacterium Poly30]|uniref:Glyoxalase-like domain-containing protein n=1 Tax=Saltatorellus ferox TaxID=2528018 RepID=A0A518F0I3_9BACT|nr:hypothetical protein Poly30_54080 [Planctomycetes bacterium Poly30]
MLGQLDHVVYLCRDLADTSGVLPGLPDLPGPPGGTPLNRLTAPDWIAVDSDGIWTAEYRLHGGAVEFLAPAYRAGDPTRTCSGLMQKVEASGPGYKSLVFGTDDLERERTRLHAAGFEPGEITASSARHFDSDERREWRRFRCADEPLHGLKVFVIERAAALAAAADAPILESVEIATQHLDRARQRWRSLLGTRETTGPTAGTLTFSLGSASLLIRQIPETSDDTGSLDRIAGVRVQ